MEAEHEEHFEVFHLEFTRVELPYVFFTWVLVTTATKLAYNHVSLLKKLPESSVMVVAGLLIGIFFFLIGLTKVTTLTPDIFFLILLPPIIMEAGYFMPNRLFFDQLGTILLMAVVGTIFNMFTIGFSLYGLGKAGFYGADFEDMKWLEALLYGSLIAAVDPVAVLAVFNEIKVDAVLNIIVFGESLLNDGVAVVLYHMFESFEEMKAENLTGGDVAAGLASFLVVAGGGTLFGIIWGYVCALTTRLMRPIPVIEPLIVVSMAYMSYLTAEIFHMSGILAATFCGVTMKNYVEKNIAKQSSATVFQGMHFLANISEMTIFIFLGVVAVQYPSHQWNTAFVAATIVCCLFWRVIAVLIFAQFTNTIRIKKINSVEQVIMMYGGLRGGVAFALCLLLKTKHANLFVTTTLATVFFTVFFQGITIKPLVHLLKVKTSSEAEVCMGERVTSRLMDLAKQGMGDILKERSEIPLRVRNWYRTIDQKFLQRLLLREQVHEPKFTETLNLLAKTEALKRAGIEEEHLGH